ncbi:kinase-like protein, partial [Wilcoxina mikolae CBS 423.85]
EALVAYEVAIDEDYISKDVDSQPTSRTASPTRKKVTADDFEPLKCLGKGAYGTVLLVRHKTSGRLYAQKQLKKATIVVHKKVVEQTKTERAILESVRHPNVVKLYYAFQDHEKLYLILEYAEGGELFHHLAETTMFCEDTAAYYIAQLVLALSHLHQNVGVVYRDLKPENCLLDASGQLLLTDFGLSKVSSEYSRCSSLLGTPGYMAPEVLSDDGSEYGAEVDWWGVGILAFELLTGKLPFEGNSPEKVKVKIQKRKLQLPSYLSNDAKDFITRLLRKEPNKRLGYNLAKDLPTIKSHRFFRKIDWALLEARELTPPIQPLVTDPLLAENFSAEFTELPLSPRVGSGFPVGWGRGREEEKQQQDPFGGFSFVATSLLEEQFLKEERFGSGGWADEA